MANELPEMRASDAERERVAERLRDAVAEGRLDMEEFEERLDAAYKARTHGDLEPLVRDLPALAGAGGAQPAPSGDRSPGGWARRIGGTATSRMAFACCGGFGRKGGWTVGRRFTAFTLMGGGELDLRDARFEDREVVIRCFSIMGGVHVVVPPDLNVDVTGIGFMGGFGESGSVEAAPDPAAPRVTVTGFALMGGVGVERKRTKAEKRRLKAERAEQVEQPERERKPRLDKGEDGPRELD
ncbi:DUF1707 domain-containing protein [Streptomyces sp. MUM 178J]|uniref:DUF1707 domain-containing protein n=1 Tax=Streptomyces sp. MUM 178J TaxID=2791991 RepID=UPI001F04967F|nr:DUF1707 domain-containing protein [Streptomyces sp. MUM 178J]WRQ79592.1 DUF1707 domain-containing protein [Streptomyces sp. MUM 178J]